MTDAPTPAAVIRNSRREIMGFFHWYDNPLASAVSITAQPKMGPAIFGVGVGIGIGVEEIGFHIGKALFPKPDPDAGEWMDGYERVKFSVFIARSMIKSAGFMEVGLNSCERWILPGFHPKKLWRAGRKRDG